VAADGTPTYTTANGAGFIIVVEAKPGTVVDRLAPAAERVAVTLRQAEGSGEKTLTVDRILSLTGYVGDHRLYRQLQVHECYATSGPMKLSAALRESTRQINALPVKGKAEEIEVHELMWQGSLDRTLIPGRVTVEPVSAPSAGPSIKLTHLGREITFRDTVYFGRESAGNHIVITDPMTSRRHSKIELRAGKFVLIDQSSNGTFVMLGGNEEMRLKREELILYGSGVISFGHSTQESGAETVQFTCN